jgi:CheY-like chemotaxis protein
MRILLLADDSITVQRVIALTFAGEPIRVVSVGDGQQAMEAMVAQRPDIVLAGTTLPQVSGYELARFMRSTPTLQHVPILLLSGAFERVDEAQLATSGANGVIEKPVEPTFVIGRVKELLGLKSDAKPAAKPAAAGRPVTPASGPQGKKLPTATPPRAVTSPQSTPPPPRRDQLRDQTGLAANTRSIEAASRRPEDYLDTLDAAFDSLDQQLSGGAPPAAKSPRNPSGPIGLSTGAADPRSPGRRPPTTPAAADNQVFEVDDEWFGDSESQARADARAGRREIAEDLGAPELRAPEAPAGNPIYEVDDDWFADNEKARADREGEQQRLAAEMGIHDVDLPPAQPAKDDFAFGVDDLKQIEAPPVAPPAAPPVAPVVQPVATVAATPKAAEIALPPPPAPPQVTKPEPIAAMPITIAPLPPSPAVAFEAAFAPEAPVLKVADDFAELLAFEQGERPEPPMAPAAEIKVVTPEITDEMLDQIARRVAEQLTAGSFGEQLRDAISATMRDTVRGVVAETSERLVGDAVRTVVAETSERLVGETVHGVVSETSERLVRDTVSAVVFEASERVVRDAVPSVVFEASERLVRDIAPSAVSEASERLVREIGPAAVSEASERLVGETVPTVVSETTDRIVRDIGPTAVRETSERLVRDIAPNAISEASERVVQDTVRAVVSETSERLVRDAIPTVVSEAAGRLLRETVPDIVSETSARLIGDTVRTVVSETAERLVREEIDRIRSRTQT